MTSVFKSTPQPGPSGGDTMAVDYFDGLCEDFVIAVDGRIGIFPASGCCVYRDPGAGWRWWRLVRWSYGVLRLRNRFRPLPLFFLVR